MQFYRLTHPKYGSDAAWARRNPVHVGSRPCLPNLCCHGCGTWGSFKRLWIDVPADFAPPDAPVTVTEWKALAPIWSKQLGLPEAELIPGMEFGEPNAEITGKGYRDFMHPGHLVWVNEKALGVLSVFRGVHFREVRTFWGGKLKNLKEPPPRYWELYVTGQAWHVGIDLQSYKPCNVCGGPTTRLTDTLSIDESRCDRSDIFYVDQNPYKIIVTERVHQAVRDAGLTEVRFIPIE